MAMPTAVVTGASRGLGRGTAAALAGAGFRVFATGRGVLGADLPPEVIRLPADHRIDDQSAAVFETVARETEGLDLLVNCAWGGYERMVEDGRFTWPAPFWEQPAHRWTGMMDSGVRAAWVCSSHAARLMIPRRRGLIVQIGFWSARRHLGNVIYGLAKAATDKLTADMAEELKPHGVAALCLYPGLVRTEAVLEAAQGGAFDLTNSESSEFLGRILAALMAQDRPMDRTGQVLVAAALARELGVTDVDGRKPEPLSLADI
jgi:dehydrogenase/reductase SDR family protein 1